MVHVLYVCPSSDIGGAQTFILQTFTQVNHELYQNHYLFFNPGPLYDALQKKGAHVYLLKSKPKTLNLTDHKKVQTELKKIMNEQNIKLVHSTTSTAALFSAWTCKLMRVPHVWFQHGPVSGLKDRLASLLPHNGLIVNSHETAQRQRELENPFRFLIPRKLPIEKLLLGSEIQAESENDATQFKNNLFSKHHLTTNTVIISMICRLEKLKGVSFFLDAIEDLRSQNLSTSFYCFIWGDMDRNKKLKKSIENKIATKKLPVALLGPIENISLALQTSPILVNASIEPEAFSTIVIEGMMLGSIPVVPDEGGPIEVVSNGKDGLIYKARHPDSLARNLKTLILDLELRKKLSSDAKETATKKYHAKRVIAQLETFYQKVLSS